MTGPTDNMPLPPPDVEIVDFVKLRDYARFVLRSPLHHPWIATGAALSVFGLAVLSLVTLPKTYHVDAEMRVEAPVLDGDEGAREIDRHFGEGQSASAHFAARREQAAVESEDLYGGRTLGDFERMDRRQMHADPGDHAGAGDHRPQRRDREPVHQPLEPRTAARAAAATPASAPLALERGRKLPGAGSAGATGRFPGTAATRAGVRLRAGRGRTRLCAHGIARRCGRRTHGGLAALPRASLCSSHVPSRPDSLRRRRRPARKLYRRTL